MNIKNTISLLLLTFLLTTACENNILDPQDDNQRSIEFILKRPETAEGFLLSAYKNLPTNYSSTDVATDNAVTNDKTSDLKRMATGEWSPLFSPVSTWDKAYEAIFHANFLLSIVNDVEWSWDSPVRNALFINKLSGEAYALRGYFYLELLKKHGGIASNGLLLGVPLILTPLAENDNWKIERASFQAVMDRINTDFDLAISLLPYKWASTYTNRDSLRVLGSQSMGRIQGQIVTALKAQAALLAASPAFNNGTYDTEKCIAAAKFTAPLLVKFGGPTAIAITGANQWFYDDDADITNPDILWRQDWILSNTLEADNYPPSLYGQGNINPSQNLVDAFPMVNGYPINNALSLFDPSNPYTKRDIRLSLFIGYNGSVVRTGTTPINTTPGSPTLDGLNLSIYSTRTGYYLKKLMRLNVNMTPGSVTSVRHFYSHIRFTELFLNYAEMANEAWGPDADPNAYGFTPRTIIARIRTRAGITSPDAYLASLDKTGLRELIRNERRIELCFEGQRFWDLRRWKLELTVSAMGVSIVGNNYSPIEVEKRLYDVPASYYGPVPQAEIIKNNLMLQNADW